MQDGETARQVDAARHLLATGQYQDAHAACLTLLARDRSMGEPLAILGQIAAAHDNHAKAIELFDRARAGGAPAAEALALKARSLIALNRREEAVSAAEAAARETPCCSFSWAYPWPTGWPTGARAGGPWCRL